MRYFFLSLLFVIIAISFLPLLASAGVVPCANSEHPEPCTLCHFIVGFNDLINYGFKILVFVALTGLVISGIMYILSAGSEEMIKTAKTFIKQILFGFGIVLLGWVFIFTVMNYFGVKSDLGIQKADGWTKFTCSTESTAVNPGGSGGAVKCGAGNIGECKKLADCPQGYELPTGSTASPCKTGEICCITSSGQSDEKCSTAGGLGGDKSGTCFYKQGSCPSGWWHIVGSGPCSMLDSICCFPEGKEGDKCGIGGKGECKTGVVSCPNGWAATMGDPTRVCASGFMCCVKVGESSETCASGSGKCFYGMATCPTGWSHPPFTTCSVSNSVCCTNSANPTANPIISLNPNSITFPDTRVDLASSPQIITITNTGDGSLKIDSVQFAGTNSSDFSQTNTCGSELAKNASCTISIIFKPTAIGDRSAIIKIASNATESIKTANLSGVGRDKQCELLAGNKNAPYVFMLIRAQQGVPAEAYKYNECENVNNWDSTNQKELSDFRTYAKSLAFGLNQVASTDRNYFAVYRLDEIYDGSNGSKLQEIMNRDCSDVNSNVFFSYGYIYKGQGDHAYAIPSTKNGYYCMNESYADKVFTHEQIGHCFASLKDEYVTNQNDAFPWSNVTKDNKCGKWQFIAAGCYMGCNVSVTTCFRSTFNSIMRYFDGGILSPVQNYIITACVRNHAANCPPVNLVE